METPIRTIRLSDETYAKLQKNREQSGLDYDLYLRIVMGFYNLYGRPLQEDIIKKEGKKNEKQEEEV